MLTGSLHMRHGAVNVLQTRLLRVLARVQKTRMLMTTTPLRLGIMM